VAGAASNCHGKLPDDGHDGTKPPHQPPGDGKPPTVDKPSHDGGSDTGGSAAGGVARPVASVESPASRAGGPLGMLPFTGGELLTLAGVGAGLTGAGGVFWRLRRLIG
jgi:hypothetical protein